MPKRIQLRNVAGRVLHLVFLSSLIATGLVGDAQEYDPRDPASISDGLDRASVIVIGRFSVDWCLPWFDGWHCGGSVHVEEFLYGDQKPGEYVPFRWKEVYGQTCLICQKISLLKGIRGIWFLVRKPDGWHCSGTTAIWCGCPLPMDCRDAVVRVIRERSTV